MITAKVNVGEVVLPVPLQIIRLHKTEQSAEERRIASQIIFQVMRLKQQQ